MGPVVNEQPKSEQSSKKQIIKIIFVFVVIVLVFAVLSYLNIIPNKSSKQDNKPTTITSAIKYSSSTFQYDPQKAEKMLTQYIKDTIKPEFLPAKIEVKQGLSIDGRTEDVKYEFGSMFNSIDSSISANFHYKEYSNISNDFETFIQPTNVTETIATVSLANSLLTSYFISPHNISDCQTKETMSYCENFQILSEGKRGYGIAIVNGTSKSMSIVFNCFVPKESKDYETQKSCIKPF